MMVEARGATSPEEEATADEIVVGSAGATADEIAVGSAGATADEIGRLCWMCLSRREVGSG
jgi:hypothetical protein